MFDAPFASRIRCYGALFVLALVVFFLGMTNAGCNHRLKRGSLPGVSETLLFRASSKGDVSEVSRLLSEGMYVDAREQDGETPLMYAAVEDQTSVVQLLLDHGATINAESLNGETALSRAVGMSRYKTVGMLLNRGADIEKGSPLIYAAGNDDIRMIRLLLDRGAKIDGPNHEGDTALAAAVSRRASTESIRLLLSAGANINMKNKRGETPLMRAKQTGDNTLVKLLTKLH